MMYAGNLTMPPSCSIEDAPTDGTFILGWSARWAGPALIHWATRHYFDDRDPVSGVDGAQTRLRRPLGIRAFASHPLVVFGGLAVSANHDGLDLEAESWHVDTSHGILEIRDAARDDHVCAIAGQLVTRRERAIAELIAAAPETKIQRDQLLAFASTVNQTGILPARSPLIQVLRDLLEECDP